jgi:cysteine synthase
MLFKNILETIGNTPMIKLERNDSNNSNLFIKLEGQNPTGSIKDRVAVYMIEEAERKGILNHKKIILEATSGNMGISLAFVGAYKGYEVHIVMSEAMSDERKKLLRSLGAKLIMTDGNFGTRGAILRATEILKENPDLYWFANQFENLDNMNSHYYGIAEEILSDIANIKMLVLGVGTGGSIMGIAKKFKEKSPDTKIIAVIPPAGYKIQGIQNPEKDFSGIIYDNSFIDEYVSVSVEDAYKTSRVLSKNKGLFLGMSSGAYTYVALQKMNNLIDANIVVISPDRGEKYLSTKLYS